MPSLSRVWAGILIASLLPAGLIAARRFGVEQQNRNVQIIVEWNEVRSLAFATGTSSPTDVLRTLKQHGLRGVAISEVTLGDLCDAGRAVVEADPGARPGTSALRLSISDPVLAAQVADQLAHKVGPRRAFLASARGASPALFSLPDGLEPLRTMGVGLPPDAVRAAREAGVEIVARLGNYAGVTKEAADWMLGQAAALGARHVIFTGTDVLGNKCLIPDVTVSLRRHHLDYGFIEFGKQRGDVEMARRVHGQLVRVHSITDAEMQQLKVEEAIDRFVKAARERNIRIIYVRLFLQPTADLVADNAKYLDSIAGGLRAAGLELGPAVPYHALYSGRPLMILTAVGIVAATVLLLTRLLVLPAGLQLALFVLGALGSAGLLTLNPTLGLGRKALALLAALVLPTLALAVYGDPGRLASEGEAERPRPGIGAALWLYLKMSAVTLAGALLVVGMLGDTRFLVKYDQFVGIKPAHVLPLFALGAIMAGGLFVPAATWRAQWQRARDHWRKLLAEPVYLWQILGMMVAVVLVGIVVLRSGNDPGVGVSPLELKFRAILDKLLWVRPRTKEFLVGHPAMLLALWAGLARRPRIWAPALLVGAIGQVSILNTFCHIHTPLLISLARVGIGLALGAVFGMVLIAVVRRIAPTKAAGGRERLT